MIFKKRKIEKLTSSHEDKIAKLKAEHSSLKQKLSKEFKDEYDARAGGFQEQLSDITSKYEASTEEYEEEKKQELENKKNIYRKNLENWKTKADIHLDKEIAKYSKKLEKEELLRINAEKQKLQTKHEKEIVKFIETFEQKKIKEQKRLEKKYQDSEVLTTKLQKYFSEILGREYLDISFKELEEELKNELKELVNEINVINKEIDGNKDKILQFNELAKEMGFLEEEIGIERNKLYELKQAIRELKKENEDL